MTAPILVGKRSHAGSPDLRGWNTGNSRAQILHLGACGRRTDNKSAKLGGTTVAECDVFSPI